MLMQPTGTGGKAGISNERVEIDKGVEQLAPPVADASCRQMPRSRHSRNPKRSETLLRFASLEAVQISGPQ